MGNGLDLGGFITGLSFDLLARHTFGSRGSYLSSFVIIFTQIGWFGVGVALITGACMTMFASFWIYRYFVEWLTVLNAALPPIGTVIILDYFMNRKDYDISDVSAVRYENIISVMVGSFIGLVVKHGIASLNAMICSAVVCVTLHFLFRNK